MLERRIYLGPVDSNFRDNYDLALGPWCFDDPSRVLQNHIMDPYNDLNEDQITELHSNLCNLAIHLLQRDLERSGTRVHHYHLLRYRLEYLFFVFFSYSKYLSLKKLISKYSTNSFLFQKSPPLLTDDFFTRYFNERYAAKLSLDIAAHLVGGDKIKYIAAPACDASEEIKLVKRSENPQTVITKTKNFLNTHLNFFKDIKGISFFQGVSLSLLLKIVSSVKLKKKAANEASSLDRVPIIDTKRFKDYIKIFDAISNQWIDKSFSDDIPEYTGSAFKITTNSLIYSQSRDSYAAGKVKNKLSLIIQQHGGCYETIEANFNRHEEAIWGKWISYGNSKPLPNRQNIFNLPNPMLGQIKDIYVPSKDKKKILWVTGSFYKTGDGLQYYGGCDVANYAKRKKIFLNSLNNNVKKELEYRPLPTISRSDFFDDIDELTPYIHQNSTQKDIKKLYSSAGVVFLDYYGTPLYELLSMNVPTVLGLFERDNCRGPLSRFTKIAKSLFEKFHKAGVLFYSPEEAALFINEIHGNDIYAWWQQAQIQDLRKEFINTYANNEKYYWKWFKSILSGQIS